ncbi:MAG: hypothetical protein IPN49_15425 [Saprospiraceae bacterium]|nr:hypothetical protein [Saprospiraceae bacterium]
MANFELGTNITLSETLAVSTGAVSNIKSGCAITMMPKILLSGGSINDEISINAGEVTFEVGGTYGGTGSPTFGNGFTWTAGGFSGSGVVHVTGILNSSSNNGHTIGGSKELRISNVATFTSAPVVMSGTAKILVLPGGSFIWNGTTFLNFSGTSSNVFEVQNGGIFHKAGTGVLTFNNIPFFNYGVLKGIGTINFAAFSNVGMVSPGLTTGVLTLNKFSNTNSTLSIDINGPGIAGTDRDSLKLQVRQPV